MIKKSLQTYYTRSQFVFAVLLHGKMLRLAFLQSVKQKIHGIFIILVVLAGVAGIDHIKQENFEIVNLVRSMCMSRDELMNFLRGGGNDAPPVETAYHEQEDMTDDEE